MGAYDTDLEPQQPEQQAQQQSGRAWDEAAQRDVADQLRALADELAEVEPSGLVRRKVVEALRYLPA